MARSPRSYRRPHQSNSVHSATRRGSSGPLRGDLVHRLHMEALEERVVLAAWAAVGANVNPLGGS